MRPRKRSVFDYALPVDSYPSSMDSFQRCVLETPTLEKDVAKMMSQEKDVQTESSASDQASTTVDAGT